MNIIYDALDTAIYRVTFKMFSYFCLACTGPESELQHHNYQRSKIPSSLKKKIYIWAPVACTCNASYSGSRDQEDLSSKPTQAKSSQDPISKNPSQK
jgi:hypothetical protein